jgi:hypothetical protein
MEHKKMSSVATGPTAAFASLFLAAVALAGDEPPFTPSEGARVEQLASYVRQQCKTAWAERKGEAPRIDPTVGDMATELQRFADDVETNYCECVGDSIRHDMKPALLRHGSPQQANGFLKTEAKQCGASAYKVAWPKECRILVRALTATGMPAAKADQVISDGCACVQPHIDAITGDNWGEVLRQFQIDYADFQAHPYATIPASPFSILSPLQACMLQAKQSVQKPARPGS